MDRHDIACRESAQTHVARDCDGALKTLDVRKPRAKRLEFGHRSDLEHLEHVLGTAESLRDLLLVRIDARELVLDLLRSELGQKIAPKRAGIREGSAVHRIERIGIEEVVPEHGEDGPASIGRFF